MNENEIVNIIIDFLFTSFLFMIVPIIIFFTGKKDFTKEQIKDYVFSLRPKVIC